MVFSSSSDRRISTKLEKEIEQKIKKLIDEHNVSDQKLFYHYVLAARSLKKKQYPLQAIKYYWKALDLNVDEGDNQMRAYLEFGHYLLSKEKLNDLKELSKRARIFMLKKELNRQNNHIEHTLNYFDVLSSQKLTKNVLGKDYHYFKRTHYWREILNYELEKRMELGLFAAAENIFKTKKIDFSEQSYDRTVAYDLLKTISLQQKYTQLKCQAQLPSKQVVQHYSYDICKILIDFQNTKKINTEKVNEVIAILKKLKGRQYLVPALKKIHSM